MGRRDSWRTQLPNPWAAFLQCAVTILLSSCASYDPTRVPTRTSTFCTEAGDRTYYIDMEFERKISIKPATDLTRTALRIFLAPDRVEAPHPCAVEDSAFESADQSSWLWLRSVFSTGHRRVGAWVETIGSRIRVMLQADNQFVEFYFEPGDETGPPSLQCRKSSEVVVTSLT